MTDADFLRDLAEETSGMTADRLKGIANLLEAYEEMHEAVIQLRERVEKTSSD